MDLFVNAEYSGFLLLEKWEMAELESTAHLFEHVKSGARLLYLENTDDNKVFCVSFRTPPNSDCGTAHIMEHSVLCGSEKYPLKEPFVELLKSSLNTFLNAMTYPDKTMYPVASRNEEDLKNLIDVYCDAVFNPVSIKSPMMFYQEGWHYHLTDQSAPLEINGVVYNEMKGALSDPEELISRAAQLSLYPDTPYAYESGGDPDFIPELSFEDYVAFYNKYYHPSNSYIYFYGDMDILAHLERLNDEYLSKYSKIVLNSFPARQPAFDAPRELTLTYPAESDASDKCYFSVNYKIGEASDTALSYRFDILNKLLMDSDASPLKKALKEADIAEDIDSDYVTACLEPYFSITAKNAPREKYELFLKTVNDTLKDICENGIDEKLIKSAINSSEFDLREADSGNYPKGLIFLIDIMESWLYDCKPGIHLEYEKQLADLKQNENSDFYIALIKELLLENKHSSSILLCPNAGETERKQAELAEKLQKQKSDMSKEELSKIIADTEKLLKMQQTPDSREALDTIPVIKKEQINKQPERYDKETETYRKANIHTCADRCRGITYVDINFNAVFSEAEKISALSLACAVLGVYKTEKYSMLELANLIGINLGGIDFSFNTFQDTTNINKYKSIFTIEAKSLSTNVSSLFDIAREILTSTVIDDEALLLRTVGEEINKFESKLISAAHNIAFERLEAASTQRGAFAENISGLSYYAFLKKVKKQLEAKTRYTAQILNDVINEVFNSNNCDILICAEAEDIPNAKEFAKDFVDRIPCFENRSAFSAFAIEYKRKEGIIASTDVAFTGMGCNFKSLNMEYDPALAVMQKYLTSEYLWNKVRVIGGAYGAMLRTNAGGTLALVSYRDPNVAKTLDVYRGIPEHIAELKLDDKQLHKLIIGTFSDIDAPVQPYTRARRALYADYKKETYEQRAANRERVLNINSEQLRSLAPIFKAVIDNSAVCAVASKSKLTKDNREFKSIRDIVKE